MSSLIKTDVRYRKWITAVSKRFRQSQLKAAVKVNGEMLRFYWGLGRDISLLSKEADYGSNFYKTISGDLKDVFRISSPSLRLISNICAISMRCIRLLEFVNRLLMNW